MNKATAAKWKTESEVIKFSKLRDPAEEKKRKERNGHLMKERSNVSSTESIRCYRGRTNNFVISETNEWTA